MPLSSTRVAFPLKPFTAIPPLDRRWRIKRRQTDVSTKCKDNMQFAHMDLNEARDSLQLKWSYLLLFIKRKTCTPTRHFVLN